MLRISAFVSEAQSKSESMFAALSTSGALLLLGLFLTTGVLELASVVCNNSLAGLWDFVCMIRNSGV